MDRLLDRRVLDVALPVTYALVVMAMSLWAQGAIAPVSFVGAMLLAVYYAVLRKRLPEKEDGPRA